MILVLRALGIGDLATAVPALRALRAAHPDEVLALVAPGWLAPLVELTGTIDWHVHAEGLAPQPLPRARLAVNLHGRGPRSHELLLAARPRRLLAFACPTVNHLNGPKWTDEDPGEHEVHRWCQLLSWYGIVADPDDLDLIRPAVGAGTVPAGVTVVHVGAKDPARRWPADRFASVASALAAGGHQIAVTGSAGQRHRAIGVARAAGLPGSAVHAGRTGLRQLAALVAQARLVVSNDTGVAHLATAYRVPSVVIFGPEPPARWGPPPDRPWHRPIWPGGTSPDIAAVTVEEVLAAVDAVLSGGPGTPGAVGTTDATAAQ